MKSLGPDFIAEFNKHKSLQSVGSSGSGSSHGLARKTSGSVRKPVKSSYSSKTSKKDDPSVPESNSSSPEAEDLPEDKEMKDDEEDSASGSKEGSNPSYNRVSFFMVFFSVIQ